APRVAADEQVLQHGRVLEQLDVLELAGDAEAGDLVRRTAQQGLAVELDRPCRRRVEAADKIEHGRLAGAVRPDQGEDLAAPYLEADVVDGADPTEAHAEMRDREKRRRHRRHLRRSDLRKLFWRLNMPRR